MNYLFSLILGVVQGLTEFLPISSSGHLVILHRVLDFNLQNNLSFDVALHLGTLVALLIYFAKDIINLILVWFKSFSHLTDVFDHHRRLVFSGIIKKQKDNNHKTVVAGEMDRRNFYWEKRLAWGILFGTIPAVLVGYYLENYIHVMFHNLQWVGLALIIVGILFFVAEKRWQNPGGNIDNITIPKAFIIGVFQALALLPGVSRSGITIITGMQQRLSRYSAARFSFLLSIPAVFGAGVKKAIDFIKIGDYSGELILILIGFLSACLVGYFCIKYFLKFLEKHSLKIFGYYRIILGVVILFLAFM